MGNGIISYDISAILILVICAAYYFKTIPKRTARDRVYIHIMLATLIGGCVDIVRILMSKAAVYNTVLWNAANVIYMVCVCSAAPLYLLYLIERADIWHLVKKHRIWIAVAVLPVAVGVIALVCVTISPALLMMQSQTGLVYSWGYYTLLAVALVYVLANIYVASKLKKYIGISEGIEFVVPMLLVIIALSIQFIFPNHHVIAFIIAITCLLLVLINRRAEDALDITTGMHSYRALVKEMSLKLKTGKEVGLILVNIVNFEHAIRLAGYDEVTTVMKQLSDVVNNILAGYKSRFLCYYNGDGKFVFEISKKQYENANDMAIKISAAINNYLVFEMTDVELRINTCIARCPEDISDIEELFMLISDLDIYDSEDKAIYQAEDIIDTTEFAMKKEMATIIEKAIANHYFSVFYQPIYNVREKRFASAEALIRLKDPKYGFISPGQFIPLAEKSGAIHAIGSFVIDEVCKFVGSKEFEELNIDYIELNLSVMQCLRIDLADEIINKARLYNVDPKRVNLEITETASAYSQNKLRNNIFTLNQAGFTFSLDDFGTGYSNLMRITSLPLSIVKLDRTFVLLEEKNDNFHTIIKNLIKMLKDMGMDILVEGVETEAMVERFIGLGVDEIQGFYFSRPLPKTDYIRFLKEHNL